MFTNSYKWRSSSTTSIYQLVTRAGSVNINCCLLLYKARSPGSILHMDTVHLIGTHGIINDNSRVWYKQWVCIFVFHIHWPCILDEGNLKQFVTLGEKHWKLLLFKAIFSSHWIHLNTPQFFEQLWFIFLLRYKNCFGYVFWCPWYRFSNFAVWSSAAE